MCPTDADRMANSVDPDLTSVGHKPPPDICPPMKIGIRGQKPPGAPQRYIKVDICPPTKVKVTPHEKAKVEMQFNFRNDWKLFVGK